MQLQMALFIWLQGLLCFTGFPLPIINLSLPAAVVTPAEHRVHTAGQLNLSELGEVLQASGVTAQWLSGTVPSHSTNYLLRLLRATSLNSTYINTAGGANPNSSTTGRQIQTNRTHHPWKQPLKERFWCSRSRPPPLAAYLACACIKMMVCTIPRHTEEDSWQSRIHKKAHKYFCFF